MLAFSFFLIIYIFIADNISILMYIMCVILCLFSALSHRVDALQISIIIVVIRIVYYYYYCYFELSIIIIIIIKIIPWPNSLHTMLLGSKLNKASRTQNPSMPG